MLLYFILFYLSFSFCADTFYFALHYFTALLCFMLCFPHSAFLQPSCLLCSGSLHLFALYTLFILSYFTLFSLHYISVCFALLRFFTLFRFGLLRFVLSRFAFLIFLGPVSAPILTSPLLGTLRVLLFLAQLASLSLAPFYFPLFRFAPSRVNPGLWRNPSRIDGAM